MYEHGLQVKAPRDAIPIRWHTTHGNNNLVSNSVTLDSMSNRASRIIKHRSYSTSSCVREIFALLFVYLSK